MTIKAKAATKLDKAGIEKNIALVQSKGVTLDKLIQATGLAIIEHVAEHKEVSLAVKLYNAMPKGSRSVALAAWFQMFGMISVNPDKKTSAERPFLFNKEGKTDLAAANDKPWFDCRKPKATLAEEFDFDADLKRFQAKLQKAVDAGKVEVDTRIGAILSMQPVVKA